MQQKAIPALIFINMWVNIEIYLDMTVQKKWTIHDDEWTSCCAVLKFATEWQFPLQSSLTTKCNDNVRTYWEIKVHVFTTSSWCMQIA